MALVQLEPGARARAWFKNDRPSLAIAHHAGLSQMTGTRNDFSATQPWAHHLGTLKSVGNATSCLISTSCLCRMGTGHACAPLKVAAEHEKLSVGNVTPHPKRVGLPAPRMRWSSPDPPLGAAARVWATAHLQGSTSCPHPWCWSRPCHVHEPSTEI